jgi:poly(A) polymerase
LIHIDAFPLLQKAVSEKLFQFFAQQGFALRFVGGCVRDALLGSAALDIDLATTASPGQMIMIFKEHHIKWIPTGIDFGTLTIVIDHTPFQITSLRQDWQTDGRRAQVLFGTDWFEDAKRRDFTFNALYADETGTIFDYFNGISDLEAGIVRFIGDPVARIEEDYLRILRFFRFYARFGKVPPDAALLAVFALKKSGLELLSRERVTDEIMRLLATSDPLRALQFMAFAEIFQAIFEKTLPEAAFAALLALEDALHLPPQGLRRLMLLQPAFTVLTQNFRLSNVAKKQYQAVQSLMNQLPFGSVPTEQDFYYYGYPQVCDAYLLNLAQNIAAQQIDLNTAIQNFQEISAHPWKKPSFPLTGQDLMDQLGLNQGPDMGYYLKACEDWWVSLQFKPGQEACLNWIREQLLKADKKNGI